MTVIPINRDKEDIFAQGYAIAGFDSTREVRFFTYRLERFEIPGMTPLSMFYIKGHLVAPIDKVREACRHEAIFQFPA